MLGKQREAWESVLIPNQYRDLKQTPHMGYPVWEMTRLQCFIRSFVCMLLTSHKRSGHIGSSLNLYMLDRRIFMEWVSLPTTAPPKCVWSGTSPRIWNVWVLVLDRLGATGDLVLEQWKHRFNHQGTSTFQHPSPSVPHGDFWCTL